MIWLGGAVLGAGLGALEARRRKGTGVDIAWFAAVGLIVGGLLGLLVAILLVRNA